MPREYINPVLPIPRAMVYVDGENLAIRYRNARGLDGLRPGTLCISDTALWPSTLEPFDREIDVIRTYYYSSVQGDTNQLDDVVDQLKTVHVQIPRVFKKPKGRRSKRVDVSLSVDMLTHACRHHYEVAVLVAGDEDYVPLVEAVQAEGCRVALWFIEDGLSPVLRRFADSFTDITDMFGGG